jgi:hypothetical protein
MELEAVGRVSMRDVGFEVCWKIDNVNGAKWAFLRANTASNTQTFRNEGDLRFRSNFNTETTASDNRTRFLAFLPAFL